MTKRRPSRDAQPTPPIPDTVFLPKLQVSPLQMASIPPISLRLPSKYAATDTAPTGPPEDWLCGGASDDNGAAPDTWWSVTHSTLALWRSAQNVRIRYRARPPRAGRASNEDRVEYEKRGSSSSSSGGGVHVVEGVNVAAAAPPAAPPTGPAAWDWRGKGWLFFVTSHWEILGWGEAPVDGGTERWAVTWFAPTLFTKEGIDIYCNRPGGLSPATEAALLRALGAADDSAAASAETPAPAWPAPLAALVAQLQPVAIRLPWQKA